MKLFFRGRRAVFFSIACAAAVNFGNGCVAALAVAVPARFRLGKMLWVAANERGRVAALALDRVVQW